MDHLATLVRDLLPPGEKMRILDCGAKDGDEAARWAPMGDRVVLYGFDPDEAECARLNAASRLRGQQHFYYPLCLAREDEEKRQFHLTKQTYSNSLLPPNERLLRRLKYALGPDRVMSPADDLQVVSTTWLKTTALDRWAKDSGVQGVDFLKLDVQGAELEVLEGGAEALRGALGLELEVCFAPAYRGQPLFADIDVFLRQRGFTFFCLNFRDVAHFMGRTASRVTISRGGAPSGVPQMAGQLISADALYLVDPLSDGPGSGRDLSVSQVLKLICIAELCGQTEYGFELLDGLCKHYARAGDPPAAERIARAYNEATRRYLAQFGQDRG